MLNITDIKRILKTSIFKTAIILFIVCVNIFYLSGQAKDVFILQTATSLRDSGLLDKITDALMREKNITLKVVAVGSGQAIENARRDNGDLLITHDSEKEKTFIKDGFGLRRIPLLRNDFVLLGAKEDIAKIANAKDIKEAFEMIKDADAKFISRSDNSGTHAREKEIWQSIGVNPEKDLSHYLETGLGQGASINIASELGAYILCDLASFAVYKRYANSRLKVLYSNGDDILAHNIYSIVTIKNQLAEEKAKEVINWLLLPSTSNLIKNTKVGELTPFTALR